MISPKCFERQWVLEKASEIGCRNPVMLEKSILALKLLGSLAELTRLTRLPNALGKQDLIMSAEATRFALGYEDNLPKGLFPKGASKDDVYRFFAKWSDQPAADDLPTAPIFHEGRKVTLTSVILGCKVIKGLEMDIVSHDVKKFFGLLLEKNGYVLEQLFSSSIPRQGMKN